MNTASKLKYFFVSTRKSLSPEARRCPSCGSATSAVVSRKYLVTTLRRCNSCQLQFRAPTTTPEENASFYQSEYSQGFTTDMPSAEELRALVDSRFKGGEKDYTRYLEVLAALGCSPGQSLFDYGCSWGYGSWQLAEAGYRVTAFEISLPRCTYAREQLGVDARSQIDEVRGPFDIFFSAHVLEHVPSLSESIALARKLLKPGGWFVAFTPNGSEAFRSRDAEQWQRFWGLVHPNFLDDRFYRSAFASDPCLLASSPYDLSAVRRWAASADAGTELSLAGEELFVGAQLNLRRAAIRPAGEITSDRGVAVAMAARG